MSNQFTWTDETVKQFARVYAAGTRGKYKKAKKIDDKLSVFKQVGSQGVYSSTPKRGRPSTTLLVDTWAFLDWYFTDDVIRDFVTDHAIPHILFTKGRFWIRIQELMDACGYLPVDVVHESMRGNVKLDENEEVDLSYYTTFKFLKP